MNRLRCDICGGQIEMQPDKRGLCLNCGTSYSLATMKEMFAGVKVSVTGSNEDVEQWRQLLDRYYSAGDFIEAERIVKKILEALPDDVQASEKYEQLQVLKYMEIKNGVLAGYSGNSAVLIIPNSVKELAPEAFKNNKYLEEVVLPDGLKTIPKGLFSGCEKLKKVCIPATVTAIENEAFYYCRSLEKVDIPPMVTDLRFRTFYGCNSLEEIDIHRNISFIAREAFCSSGLKKVGLHTGLKIIGEMAFAETQLEELVLPEGLEAIIHKAFYNCKSLKRLVLPNNEVEIPEYEFDYREYCPGRPWDGCSNIESINFRKGLDAKLFYGTKFMRERLPKHVCPCCGGKIGFFKQCKNCGWDAPDSYWTWR